MKRFLCILALLGLTGCGTMMDAVFTSSGHGIGFPGEFRVYGGIRVDLEAMDTSGYNHKAGDVAGWCWIFDMPFSAAMDTVLLPFTALNAWLCSSKP